MEWKQKLTSRKLWVSIAGFVSMMIVFLGGSDNTATQVTALIMAGASTVAYLIGQGLVDAKQASQPLENENISPPNLP